MPAACTVLLSKIASSANRAIGVDSLDLALQSYGTRSPVSKSELQMQLSVCNCMYISMSYYYSK
eukprot:COSAG02_NODE_8399_length_2585_cov_4.830652_1_plen_63_part_10